MKPGTKDSDNCDAHAARHGGGGVIPKGQD